MNYYQFYELCIWNWISEETFVFRFLRKMDSLIQKHIGLWIKLLDTFIKGILLLLSHF